MSLNTEKINSETHIAYDTGTVVIQQYSADKESHKVIVITEQDAISIANFINEVTTKGAA